MTARASVWLADHNMPDTGTTEPTSGDMHEVWGLLPAVAAVTHRARVGTLVSPTTMHHPALLAKRAATIDHLPGGRMVLGIGAGWQINEHAAYGIDLTRPVSRFAEALPSRDPRKLATPIMSERELVSGQCGRNRGLAAHRQWPERARRPSALCVGVWRPEPAQSVRR